MDAAAKPLFDFCDIDGRRQRSLLLGQIHHGNVGKYKLRVYSQGLEPLVLMFSFKTRIVNFNYSQKQ